MVKRWGSCLPRINGGLLVYCQHCQKLHCKKSKLMSRANCQMDVFVPDGLCSPLFVPTVHSGVADSTRCRLSCH